VVYSSHDHPGLEGFDGRACFVAPERATVDTTYVVAPGEDANSLDLLSAAFPQGEIVAQGPLHYGQPYYLAFHVPQGSEAAISPANGVEAAWADKIRLLGYDLDAEVYQAGDTVQLTLYYQALQDMDKDYTVFTHIRGPENPATGNPLWGQSDSEPCRRSYPTSAWSAGEIVRDPFAISLAGDAPPGEYELLAGFYLLETLERLPATGADGEPVLDNTVPLGTIRVGE
jgi:hypothetical protein